MVAVSMGVAACTRANPAYGVDGTGDSGDEATTKDKPSTTDDSQTGQSTDASGTGNPTHDPTGDPPSTTTAESSGGSGNLESGTSGPVSASVSDTEVDPDTGGTTQSSDTIATSTGMSDGETMGVGMCAIGGEACAACLVSECCEVLATCLLDSDCECMALCVGGGDGPKQCLEACGFGKGPVGWQPVIDCASQSCGNANACPNLG